MNNIAFPLLTALALGVIPASHWVSGWDSVALAGGEETARVTSGTVLAPDGVEIAFDVRGTGDTTLLFIHCWSCDRSYWREQLDAFADEYRVVSLDLAGHGVSGRDRETWTIVGYAGDVLAVVEELDLQRVILIGHSMGGPVSLEAARLLPNRVIGVACVDTLHNVEMKWDPEVGEQWATQLEADFVGERAKMMEQMFLPDSDGELANWVAEQGESVYAPAAIALARDFPSVDTAAAMSQVEVPIRCVNANALPPMIPETAVEINQQYADFDAAIMYGVGHFLHLEQPTEFNLLLEEAIVDIEG
ncbi:MAG: alpha/beta fold hydrolase [Synechococcus sp.]